MAPDDVLEDGEWRLPEEPSKEYAAKERSINAKGDADELRRRGGAHYSSYSGRSYDDRPRSRSYSDYNGAPRGGYRSFRKPFEMARGPSHRSMPPPYEGRPPSRGYRGDDASDVPPRYSVASSARYSSYADRPKFSMGRRGGSYESPGMREGPRALNRESHDRSPFSMEEYQEKMRHLSRRDPDFASVKSPKASGLHKRRDGNSLHSPRVCQLDEKDSKNEESLGNRKSLNPADILEKIKRLDEKKDETKRSMASLDDDIESLKEALPILTNEVGRTSDRAPVPPSPISLNVSEEKLSSDSEDESDDESTETNKKKRGKSSSKQSSGRSRNLQRCIELLAPEQRKLISKFGQVLKENKEHDLNKIILKENERISYHAGNKFSRLYPAEMQRDLGTVEAQKSTTQRLEEAFIRKPVPISSGVYNALRKELVIVLKQHVLAGIRYRFAFEKWLPQEKQRLASQVLGSPPRGISTHGSFTGKPSVFDQSNEPTSPSLGRSSSRGGRNRGIVRSDLEERVAIATLQAVESVKSSTTLPTQLIFTERSARWVKHYQDWNRLVKNPRKEWEENEYVRVWSQEEKNIFAEKFLIYHKDFARISTYLPRRTIPEIIKHYYGIQRTKEFEVTRRKWQLRKRREKAEETAMQRMGGGAGHIGMAVAPQHYLEPEQRMDSVKTTDSTHDSSASGKQKGRKGSKKHKAKAKKHEGNNSEQHCVDTYFDEHPKPNSFGPRLKRPSTRSFELLSHLDSPKKEKQATETVPSERQDSLRDSKSDGLPAGDYRLSSSKLDQLADTSGKDVVSKKSKSSDTKSVGRGRLPNANTDKKYIEAVQIYGKDFASIASYMNRTVDAAKKYWERHSQRLNLERLLDDPAKPLAHEKSDVSHVEDKTLEYNLWNPVLSILGLLEDTGSATEDVSDTVATMRPHLASIPPSEWVKLDSMLLPGGEVGSLLTSHAQSRKLLSGIPDIQKGRGALEDVIELVRGVESYFEIYQQATPEKHGSGPGKKKKGRGRPVWTDEDKESLTKAYEKYGRDWEKLQEAVPSKTMTQIKNFYQNYRAKYFTQEDTSEAVKRKAWSDDADADENNSNKKPKHDAPSNKADISLLSLPKEVLSTLPQGVLDKMEEVMTNPTAQMEFKALMMMQASSSPSTVEEEKKET